MMCIGGFALLRQHVKFCDSRFSGFCMGMGCFKNLGSGMVLVLFNFTIHNL